MIKANVQFKRSPTRMLAVCRYWVNKVRPRRAFNFVEGVGEAKEQERTEINMMPSFEGAQMSVGTFNSVGQTVINLAQSVYQFAVDRLIVENQPVIDEQLVEPLRLMEELRGNTLWVSLGVLGPSIEIDRIRGVVIADCEFEIVMALLELGRDQARPTRLLVDGELDPSDAMPAELMKLKKVAEAKLIAEKRELEDNLRVNNTAGNKKKGGTKRTFTGVPLAIQEAEGATKKAELQALRKLAENGAAEGRQNELDTGMGNFMSVTTALRTAQLRKGVVEEHKVACGSAWAMLQHERSFVGDVGVDLVTQYLEPLGCFESEDLLMLSVAQIEHLVSLLKVVCGLKFAALLKSCADVV